MKRRIKPQVIVYGVIAIVVICFAILTASYAKAEELRQDEFLAQTDRFIKQYERANMGGSR